MYIVIEGQDATGKDTQAKMLADYFRAQGKKVVHYSESGTNSEDPFNAEIARLTYGTNQDISHRVRTLLYLINRYDQWQRIAEPALKAGDIVITTRNWFSTLIYEGCGGGVSKTFIKKLHKETMPKYYFNPDKIVCFTLSNEERKKRLESQGKKRSEEVWKSMSSFQQKVNNYYLEVATEYNIPMLDASGTPEEVFEKLKKLFQI